MILLLFGFSLQTLVASTKRVNFSSYQNLFCYWPEDLVLAYWPCVHVSVWFFNVQKICENVSKHAHWLTTVSTKLSSLCDMNRCVNIMFSVVFLENSCCLTVLSTCAYSRVMVSEYYQECLILTRTTKNVWRPKALYLSLRFFIHWSQSFCAT